MILVGVLALSSFVVVLAVFAALGSRFAVLARPEDLHGRFGRLVLGAAATLAPAETGRTSAQWRLHVEHFVGLRCVGHVLSRIRRR